MLDVAPISIDWENLEKTDNSYPFHRLGWELLARAGQIGEQVAALTGLESEAAERRPLTLDEQVLAGLFVRMAKLLRGIFDSSQASESEAHQVLARCAVETAANLRWLVRRSDPEEFKRFRADSFVTWRTLLGRITPTGDEILDATDDRLRRQITEELAAAGLTWDDIPARPGSWGRGSFRQRLDELGLGELYDLLFATHSSYVHGSWHEIRAFHLKTSEVGVEVDLTFGEVAPTTLYEVAKITLDAAVDYTRAMPLPAGLERELAEIAERTGSACAELAAAFAGFIARGGLDSTLERHSRT